MNEADYIEYALEQACFPHLDYDIGEEQEEGYWQDSEANAWLCEGEDDEEERRAS